MSWYAVVSRILLVLLPAAAIGWYFGYWLGGVCLALLAVLVFWSMQMQRLQQWLVEAGQPPPDLPGAWGEIVSRIYHSQQTVNKDRDRLQSMVDYLLESFTSMRDGVVIVEGEGGIRWCNQSATRLLGLRHPQDVGQPLTSLVRQPAFTEYFNASRFDEPLQFQTGGESNRNLQVIITHFADGDRLLFVRDVTTQVRTERMRRDFVGNVSHELRTPLTVITGYLDTILADTVNLPPTYRKPLQQMAQQAERMERMLRDLLWLSRIESEEQIAKREQVDMAGLLDELRDELRNVYPGREMDLQVESRFKVTGDYRELYSAVGNLVHNAFKYSPQGTPVTVKWRQAGEEYLLSVEDQGVGIDPAHFGRLTERFYRVDDSRSSSTGGTGLGLAIVKHVAVAHGARLEIDSQLGKGSIFTLRFPVVATATKT